jgi:hypothetical protein
MFIRFNGDAVMGRRPGGKARVMEGTCVELTADFQERPSSQGSVKALFKAIAAAEQEEKVQQGAAEDSEENKENEEKHPDDLSFGSEAESEEVSSEEQESDSGSEDSQSSEEELAPVSRSATIAKQVALDTFIEKFVRENNVTALGTRWRSGEFENLVQGAAIREHLPMTASELKKLIRKAVCG